MVLPFTLVMVLVAPSIISYTPYRMAWDDLYFLHCGACLHNAVYRLDLAGMVECYSIVSKSPILTFMMLPWGTAASGEAAVPLALISLAILNWILVLLIYRVAIAAGSAVWMLPVAALAVWLNPFIGMYGGSFLSDMLVAWCTLLLLLLLPLELRTNPGPPRHDVARGALWGLVIVVGVLTKVTFILFLAVIGLAIISIRFRLLGARSCLRAALTAAICALPAMVIWIAFGRNFIGHAVGFSFGSLSKFYAVGGMTPFGYLREYLKNCGWGCFPTLALVPYFAWRVWRSDARWLRMLPLALVLFYFALCALSPNGDYRFAMPVMIALPFVLAVVPSKGADQVPPGMGLMGFALLAGVLCSIPMLARPDMTYVRHAGTILDRIARPGVKILLATDDPFLNIDTFLLAKEFRRQRLPSVAIDTLVYDSLRGRSMYDGFHRLEAADYILFKKPPLSTEPEWANQFANEYYQYATGVADETDVPSEYMHVLKVRPPGLLKTDSSRPILAALSTDPTPPRPGIFRWTITGSGFTPGSGVIITGRGCEAGCRLNPESFSFKSVTELTGLADLTNGAGTYEFQVMNGPVPSNVVAVEIRR